MNRKTCYCVNPSCKCVYGCGCTLGDKSVGKCMCCVMEEMNQKMDKLRRKKNNTTVSGSGGNCKCDLGKQRFYDIIVKYDVVYYSVRYGCLVEVKVEGDITCECDDYIKANQNDDYDEIELLTYETSMPIEKNKDEKYYLLFVDRETLNYGLYYPNSVGDKSN